MSSLDEFRLLQTRRHFFGRAATGLGIPALASLLAQSPATAASPSRTADMPSILGHPHFAPRAKRVIYLCMQGGPSQIETFDHKPTLTKRHGQELPGSVRMNQRLTGMTS